MILGRFFRSFRLYCMQSDLKKGGNNGPNDRTEE